MLPLGTADDGRPAAAAACGRPAPPGDVGGEVCLFPCCLASSTTPPPSSHCQRPLRLTTARVRRPLSAARPDRSPPPRSHRGVAGAPHLFLFSTPAPPPHFLCGCRRLISLATGRVRRPLSAARPHRPPPPWLLRGASGAPSVCSLPPPCPPPPCLFRLATPDSAGNRPLPSAVVGGPPPPRTAAAVAPGCCWCAPPFLVFHPRPPSPFFVRLPTPDFAGDRPCPSAVVGGPPPPPTAAVAASG